MGFFDKILGGGKPQSDQRWYLIRTTQELDDVISASGEKSQVIFKHSNSCGVSFFAKKNLDSMTPEETSEADLYMIDVLRNRDVSYYLADKFQIRHESPQAFVIKNKKVVWSGSHNSVTSENLLKAIA